jgi:predicted anti-sigma-YlaC factor YlaD
MGRVKSADCDQTKGLIALSIVGKLPEAEQPALLAHLEGCEACREDERQLRPLVAGLGAADVDRVDDEAVPHDLSKAVLGDLSARSRKGRRAARMRYALAATAAAAVLVIVFVLVGGSEHTTEKAALVGTPGVKATAQLTAESWGTSVAIEESAQRAGQVMWVSMSTRSGSWWDSGTYRAVAGQTVHVTLACALKLHDIEYLDVRNSAGKVVLRADFS